VLTSRGGGIPELGGDAVAYADPEDIADLADSMGRLAGDSRRGRSTARPVGTAAARRGALAPLRSPMATRPCTEVA